MDSSTRSKACQKSSNLYFNDRFSYSLGKSPARFSQVFYSSSLSTRSPVDGRAGGVERVVPEHEVDAVAGGGGRRVAGQLRAPALHRHYPRHLPLVVDASVAANSWGRRKNTIVDSCDSAYCVVLCKLYLMINLPFSLEFALSGSLARVASWEGGREGEGEGAFARPMLFTI